MKILILFFLSTQSLATDIVNVAHCGARPNLIERMFTDAEQIRIRCIDEAYESNRRKLLEEAHELSDFIKKLEEELKKVAFEYSTFRLQCSATRGQTPDEERTRKCREINEARNAAIDRMNTIMGWNERPAPRSPDTPLSEITPPCPSREDLQKIQGVRYFNRKLYQTWERCVQLSPENYYN